MRKRYAWLAVIDAYGLSKKFDDYKKKHPDISINRAARAFVIHSRVGYKLECFERDKLEDYEAYCLRVAQIDWIGDC